MGKWTRWLGLLGMWVVMGCVAAGVSGHAWGEGKKKDNAMCVVCHAEFKEEGIARGHESHGVLCTKCHGDSAEHMQDETLMTKPDTLWKRQEIVGRCEKCHDDGHEKPDEVAAFKAKLLDKRRENGRVITADAICTDCHGSHYIVKEHEADTAAASGWISLFNSKDLTGWVATGNAAWTVENGCLVGRQGPNCAPGDLFTKQEFDDFELVVTFKMHWPGNSGVWFRYQTPDKSYQADILEYTNPVCYAGSLYCPGKMFLAMNEDPDIVNREQWNTLLVRAEGDHLIIALNGVVTGDVHEDSFASGKIGFQVHPGDYFKDMQIIVRKITLRSLNGSS